MYLNLDLLYNVYKFLFPLFYYKSIQGSCIIYLPITKKSISIYPSKTIYYNDHITGTFRISDDNDIYGGNKDNQNNWVYFIEKRIIYYATEFKKCNLKKIKKEHFDYLKNNIRIKFQLK